jgi:hypothetical protein
MSLSFPRTGSLILIFSTVLAACGPSLDSAAKLDIDRRVAALVPVGQSFSAPSVAAPKPLQVGQWTLYKLVNEKGEPSLTTYKIVGEDSGAFWVEVADESYLGKTVIKLLVAFGDRANPSTMEVRSIKVKDKNGKITGIEGPTIESMRSLWQGAASLLAVSWRGLPQESMEVVAGNFASCFRARTQSGWGLLHSASNVWSHPMVPVIGLVKSAGLDRPTTMELVGFGDSGATSEIPTDSQ